MLKVKVNSLEGINEKFHAFYTEQDDGTFLLDADLQPEDTSGLKNTNAKLKQEKKEALERAAALQAKIDATDEKKLEEKQEYDKLLDLKTKQHEALLEAEKTEKTALVKALEKQTLTAAQAEIGAELAGENALLIMPHLKDRLAVEFVNHEPKLQVLDKDGNPGILTKEQLIEEFKTNDTFAPILKGRDSSGGGSGGGSGAGGEVDASTWEQYFDEDNTSYNTAKQSELAKLDKNLHDTLVKKFNLDDPYRV